MITKLEHVALSVSNLDRSLSFYRDVIGFEFIRFIDCPAEGHLGYVVGIEKCSARIAQLQLGQCILELFEYHDPRGKEISHEHNQADLGFTHMGFTSTDMATDHARLKDNGVEFVNDPIEYRSGVWVCYFYGPDREVCELRQA